MGDTTIVYDALSIDTFKREIINELGGEFWSRLTDGITLPDIDTECKCECRNMRVFIERLESMAEADTVKTILYKVRHGLHVSQSAWAREKFLKYGDIDVFLKVSLEEQIKYFEELNHDNKDFYGDMVTDEALKFLKEHPSILAPVRKGNKLYCIAFPANMQKYIEATDPKMKRYHGCHCPFAKESILAEKTVSGTLCNCSLGHVMNFVEAFLDRSLEGKVLQSMLAGDIFCEYEITIPDDIMEKYVKNA